MHVRLALRTYFVSLLLFSFACICFFPCLPPLCSICCKDALQHSATWQLLPEPYMCGCWLAQTWWVGRVPLPSSCLITCLLAQEVRKASLSGPKGACNRAARSPAVAHGPCCASPARFRQLPLQVLCEAFCKTLGSFSWSLVEDSVSRQISWYVSAGGRWFETLVETDWSVVPQSTCCREVSTLLVLGAAWKLARRRARSCTSVSCGRIHFLN